jgi:hypothetical protein
VRRCQGLVRRRQIPDPTKEHPEEEEEKKKKRKKKKKTVSNPCVPQRKESANLLGSSRTHLLLRVIAGSGL